MILLLPKIDRPRIAAQWMMRLALFFLGSLFLLPLTFTGAQIERPTARLPNNSPSSAGSSNPVSSNAGVGIGTSPRASGFPSISSFQEPGIPYRDTTRSNVQFSNLDTYYLPDKDGNLIPIFKFSFEEFEELLQQRKRNVPGNVPLVSTFRFEKVSFDTQVDNGTNDASLQLQFELTLNETGWQQIPLGLANWVVAGPIQGPIANAYYLYRMANGNLSLAIQGKAGERLDFRIPLSTTVETFGELNQLKFSFAYPTETAFALRIDEPNLTVSGIGQIGLQTTERVGKTTINLDELSDKTTISWQKLTEGERRFPTKARIETNIKIDAVSIGRWQITSAFDVTPLGQPISELLISCPKDTQDFVVLQSNVRAARVDFERAKQLAAKVADEQTEDQFYLLSFNNNPLVERTQLQVSFFLANPIDEETQQAGLDLVGPQIYDSVFVAGTIALTRERELSNQWKLGPGVNLGRTSADAKDTIPFVFDRQNFQLQLINRLQSALVRVVPQYTLIVNQRVLMPVQLRCQVQGQYSDMITLDLGDWNFLSGSAGIKESSRVLEIDLSSIQPSSSNEVVFDFTLEREAGNFLDLNIPNVQGNPSLVSEPAEVILVVEDKNKEFNFDSIASSVVRATAGQDVFRPKQGANDILLRGSIDQKPRRVELSQLVEIVGIDDSSTTLDPESLWVRQRLNLAISNQPLNYLWLLLETKNETSTAQIFLGDEVLSVVRTPITIADRSFLAIEFQPGTKGLINSLQFSSTERIDLTASKSGTSGKHLQAQIPILQPMVLPVSQFVMLETSEQVDAFIQSQIASFEVRRRELVTPIATKESYQLNPRSWVTAEQNTGQVEQRWLSNHVWPTHTQLDVDLETPIAANTFVQEIHLQTWWDSGQRMDRMLALVESYEEKLAVDIENTALVKRVLVNGQAIAHQTDTLNRQIIFNLPPGASPSDQSADNAHEYLIEIWYARNVFSTWWWIAELDLPRLPNQDWCRHFSWHILTNDTWRTVWNSPELSPVAPLKRNNLDAVGATGPAIEQPITSDAAANFTGNLASTSAEASKPLTPRQLFVQAVNADSGTERGAWYAGQRIPTKSYLVMTNRYWLRLATISVFFLAILIAWLLQWFRRSLFWILLSFAVGIIAVLYPQLGIQVAPYVGITLSIAVAVLFLERLLTKNPTLERLDDPFSGTTRTVFRGESQATQNPANEDSLENRSDSRFKTVPSGKSF